MDSVLSKLSPKEFPPLLKEIPDAPKQLYVRGKLPSLEKKWLAVVGSRAISHYGRQVCEHLIRGLAGYPIVIVSGLAYGVDACAHSAALDAGIPTVGVPGSGLDWSVVYPRANVSLAKRILKEDGALLSEFAPEQKAADYTFPKRNRIMAGLCNATLVIAAKERSGSLITARLTTEYNRELLVALNIDVSKKENVERADLSEEERFVLSLITSPLSRDELLRELNMPISEAQVLLSMMEIKGLLVEEYGSVRAT